MMYITQYHPRCRLSQIALDINLPRETPCLLKIPHQNPISTFKDSLHRDIHQEATLFYTMLRFSSRVVSRTN
jgi:hypothetical protein